MRPSRRGIGMRGLAGASLFDGGITSIYSPKTKALANKVAVAAGIVAVGCVGYVFWKGERR